MKAVRNQLKHRLTRFSRIAMKVVGKRNDRGFPVHRQAERAGGDSMKIYEFGTDHAKTFVMFPCTAEPWWVFRASAEAMARDYHVYLVMADGHDETGTEFVSLEKNAADAAKMLRQRSISRIDAMYGVSMGGATAIRFLATENMPVDRAIIDAGITPYPYPRFLCRLIALKDWCMIMLGTKSMTMMKVAAPPGQMDAQRRGPGGTLPPDLCL